MSTLTETGCRLADFVEVLADRTDPARYPHAAFFAFAFPPPDGYETATLSPPAARWHPELHEYILNWDDARAAPDPHRAALDFGRSALQHACAVCGWDPDLAASAQGVQRRGAETAGTDLRR